jgi:hypothetical protein
MSPRRHGGIPSLVRAAISTNGYALAQAVRRGAEFSDTTGGDAFLYAGYAPAAAALVAAADR